MHTLSAASAATNTGLLDTADRGVLLPQTARQGMTAFAFATLCPRCGGVVASDAPATILDTDDARWHQICAQHTLAETRNLRRVLRALVTRLIDGALGDYAPLMDEVLDGCAALTPCDATGKPVAPGWADTEEAGAVSGLGPTQIIVLSDLVRYLQDAGWVLTLHPNGDWVTFRHDAQPVTVLLPQRVTAPGAAALLSGALATLATLAGCSVPTFVAALDTAMEAVKTPSAAVSSAEGDGMGREIS